MDSLYDKICVVVDIRCHYLKLMLLLHVTSNCYTRLILGLHLMTKGCTPPPHIVRLYTLAPAYCSYMYLDRKHTAVAGSHIEAGSVSDS